MFYSYILGMFAPRCDNRDKINIFAAMYPGQNIVIGSSQQCSWRRRPRPTNDGWQRIFVSALAGYMFSA